MSYLSNHDHSQAAVVHRPDPFVSLAADGTRQGRRWLFNLLMGPFEDHDERANHHLAGKDNELKSVAGIRTNKAWNGNGRPNSDPGLRRRSA